MKVGLVMEGGSMRGLYTAGVMDVFMENGIAFDAGVGTSAGAVFGCNYKSHQIGRVLRYNKRFCRDKRYAGFGNLLKTGNVFGVDFCYRQIPELHDKFDSETYKNSPMEFYVTCTDIESGKAVHQKCDTGKGKDLLWMRASASMPLVSTIVEIDGRKYLDGGIADSIPLEFAEEIGCKYNVVILTRPDGYVKEKNSFLPAIKWRYKKYPKFVEAVENRHERYNNCLSFIKDREKSGHAFVIRPSVEIDVKTVENSPERLQKAYDLGRNDAMKCVGDVIKFIDNAKNQA